MWPLLLLSLTACGSKVSIEAVTQTLRAGDLEITVTSPKWVTPQEFYPLKVSYANKSDRAVEFSDPFHCPLIWNVEDETSGKVLEPKSNHACRTDMPPNKVLGPGENYSGEFKAIISKYPKGQYRIAPQQLQMQLHSSQRALQPIQFQIR